MSESKKVNKGKSTIRYSMCGDRIALHEFKQKEKDKIGSLYIPMGNQERQVELSKAKVLAVGPDVKTVEVGDIVVTPYGLGTHLLDGDETYAVLPENAIMAIDSKFDEEKECE
jgi:co-chaperonin GroES (HSP10)